ncbi:MAG: plastocyanin/azurin family copper-binding protein [Methanobacteriota archaeon]
MTRTVLLAVSLLVLAVSPLVFAAEEPAAGGPAATWPGTPEDAWNVTVVMKGTAFVPGTIVVPPGATITWVNRDGQPHDVQGPDFDSGEPAGMDDGATFAHTFDKAGTFEYYCEIHTKGVMAGTVIVSADGAPPAGAGGHEADPNASAVESGFVEITKVGVAYLAYWMGLLAFVAVIVTLVFLFFFLKYGETPHAADQTAREPVAAGAGAVRTGDQAVDMGETLWAVLLSILALALLFFLLDRVVGGG